MGLSAFALALLSGLGAIDAATQAALDRATVDSGLVVEVKSGHVLATRGRVDRPLPPGSTFKLVTALAAFRAAPDTLSGERRCAGRARIGGEDLKCWRPSGHGAVDLEVAIAGSCNLYFGAVGDTIGTRALIDEARLLGVGTGVGRLPAADGAAAGLGAHGQGVLTTTRQMAGLGRQLALGRRGDGAELAAPDQLQRLLRGMHGAVHGGTASRAASSVEVAGKTGTATMGSGELGWFLGLAPAADPTMVIVLTQRGRTGAAVAGEAHAIIEAFFHGRGTDPSAPRPARLTTHGD